MSQKRKSVGGTHWPIHRLSVSLHESLGLREDLLLRLLLILVQLLLRSHAIDHVHHVHRRDVNLLLFGRKWSLRRLQSFLLVLLFLGSLFWVLSDGTLIGIAEEHGLFFRSLVIKLRLFVLFDEDTVNRLMDSLRGRLLEVFLFTLALQVQYVLKQGVIDGLAFLLLRLLDLN